jgi:hypothetical protein
LSYFLCRKSAATATKEDLLNKKQMICRNKIPNIILLASLAKTVGYLIFQAKPEKSNTSFRKYVSEASKFYIPKIFAEN